MGHEASSNDRHADRKKCFDPELPVDRGSRQNLIAVQTDGNLSLGDDDTRHISSPTSGRSADGSAPALGAGSQEFESPRPDQFIHRRKLYQTQTREVTPTQ